MAKDQLERFRATVDDDTTGSEVETLAAELDRKKYAIGAIDELKTAPRGYAKDHPRIELLRRKGLMASRSWAPATWMHSKQAAQKVRDAWVGAGALCGWLDRHVGPSTEPPGDRPF